MTIPRIYTRLQAQHQQLLNIEDPITYLTTYTYFQTKKKIHTIFLNSKDKGKGRGKTYLTTYQQDTVLVHNM